MQFVMDKAIELHKLLELVDPLLEKNSGMVGIVKNEGGYSLKIDGFYKHGSLILTVSEQTDAVSLVVDAIGRYGKLTTFYNPTFEDLVRLNYYQWMDYKDRGFTLDERWLPFLLEAGLVKEQVSRTYVSA